MTAFWHQILFRRRRLAMGLLAVAMIGLQIAVQESLSGGFWARWPALTARTHQRAVRVSSRGSTWYWSRLDARNVLLTEVDSRAAQRG